MFELYFIVVSFLFALCGGSSYSLMTCCTGRNVDPWNSHMVAANIEIWLRSGVTVAGEGKIQSRLFHQHTGAYVQHFAYYNDKRVDDEVNEFKPIEEFKDQNVDRKYGNDDDEDCDYPYFNENDRSVVTIGQFSDGIPSGRVWQWRSRRFEDGFLNGQVNIEGRFTGDNITFIYPDLKTGIRGTFVDGKLVAGLEVKIIGERCSRGIKELRFETVEKRKEIVWKRENLNATYIGRHPIVRDPLERKNTYIGHSTIPGSDEGVFAKRALLPGQLVMYFSGMKLQEEDVFSPEMNRAETLVAGAYYFGFARTFPGLPEYLCIDQPPGYRHVKDYRTTLGHKINHNFIGINTKWGFVRHPSHGPVVSLIATEPIAKGHELFVNYNYNLNGALTPQWYMDLAREVNGRY